MGDRFVLLTEKEEMWGRMLIEVLEDHRSPCAALPVFGAGFAIKTGMQERLKVFVPEENMPQAMELVEELFSAEVLPEGEEADFA